MMSAALTKEWERVRLLLDPLSRQMWNATALRSIDGSVQLTPPLDAGRGGGTLMGQVG
jgi:hypothetical protein